MNGIKKAFSSSNRRSSEASSVSDVDAAHSSTNTTPETSPKQAPGKKLMDEPLATRKEPVDVQRTGAGKSAVVASKDDKLTHTVGHGGNMDPTNLKGKVTEDTQHVAHRTEETRQHHTIEEVTRQRDLQSHHHHVQMHSVPVVDTEHKAERKETKMHPVTHVHEKHASTDKDAQLLAAVAAKHGDRDLVKQAASTHQIVDRGEVTSESVHHHVHHVIQPVIMKDTHEHTRTHTTIPVRHEVHHAPIIHEAIRHTEPISKAQFLKEGGILGAKTTKAIDAGVLHEGDCDRKVDGVAEKLAKDLHLAPGTAI